MSEETDGKDFDDPDASDDPHSLERFVEAQDAGGTYPRAVAELRQGRKVSHWMWFVFPQLAGLGHSAMSQRFAIASLEQARAYLRHPVLGARLVECAEILAGHRGVSARQVFGEIDAVKLRSSMTLFARAAAEEAAAGSPTAGEPAAGPLFEQVLARYFDGSPDPATEERL